MPRIKGPAKKQVLLRFELPIHDELSRKAAGRGKSLPIYLQDLVINVDAPGPALSVIARDFRDRNGELTFKGDLKERAEAVDAERLRRKRPRREALGYVIQPRE